MDLAHKEETYAIIGAAMEVHGVLGPGYLEAVYQEALEIEFGMRQIIFKAQPEMRIEFKGQTLTKYYVPDFIVFDLVLVEIKAHSAPLSEVGQKQILNSLTCSGLKVGLLINFVRASLDYKRFVN